MGSLIGIALDMEAKLEIKENRLEEGELFYFSCFIIADKIKGNAMHGIIFISLFALQTLNNTKTKQLRSVERRARGNQMEEHQ